MFSRLFVNDLPPTLQRRSVLKGSVSALCLMAVAGLPIPALSQTEIEGPDAPFDFERLTQRMREAAQMPYAPPETALPAWLAGLDYDAYRLIQYRNEQAKWNAASHDFRLQAFHPGWLYPETVSIFEVVEGRANRIDFSHRDFQYRDPAIAAQSEQEAFPGVAGLRVHHPMGGPGLTELASFVGASYFRALGRDNIYGASARGLAINTWAAEPEQFPRFSHYYLERPEPGEPLVFYAALDGASVTGAYRFSVLPASQERQETVVEVSARLFFREDIAELGIAPLTSMFLFSEVNRDAFDDYRPQVHDSDGLMIERETGEILWRPLSNTEMLGNSYLAETNPAAFGLYQRDRRFDQYHDAGAHYEKRPSVRIEPIGSWGAGAGMVRLVEIPARSEADDNIVAYWIPAQGARAGEEARYDYRVIWGNLDPDSSAPLAHVQGTRVGGGGVSGVIGTDGLRKFVIDFTGDALDALPSGTTPDLFNSVGNGTIVSATLSPIREQNIWRAVLDVKADGTAPVELKVYLVGAGRVLTETWIYQWRPQV